MIGNLYETCNGRHTCESGSIAVEGRNGGGDGFSPFASFVGVFRIKFIGNFLLFTCGLPTTTNLVSISAIARIQYRNIFNSLAIGYKGKIIHCNNWALKPYLLRRWWSAVWLTVRP